MDDAKRIEIERNCERLVTRYCHLIDHGEAEKVSDLFSKDGVWKSAEANMEGQDAVRRGFGARQANAGRMSRHVCNNLLIDVVDEDHAEGCVYLTLYRHDGDEGRRLSPLDGPVMVGEYRDRFVRTTDGWRFSQREARASFFRRPND
jgi:hypothetical protein